MRAVAGVPAGWAGRVFAGLEALTHLKHGTVIVETAHVKISGTTHQPDAKDEISRILGDALQGRGTFAIDVTYIEIKEPEIILPSPRECVDTINAILADNKITFDPGSADIDRRVRGTLDRIAEVMKDCTAVPMEIAGHTDSQGRESMNLGLSQRRAETVLEALMARRVLVANLTARGYGESIPIADNDTEEGRETNRRIEFTLRVRPGSDDSEEPGEEVAEDEADQEGSDEAPAPSPEEEDTASESTEESATNPDIVTEDETALDADAETTPDPNLADTASEDAPAETDPETVATEGPGDENSVEPEPEITVTVVDRPEDDALEDATEIIPAPRPASEAADDTEDDS